MKVNIVIDMDSRAFVDAPTSELGRILRPIMYGVELRSAVRTER